MEYLQYKNTDTVQGMSFVICFKPYYKWNTFNTEDSMSVEKKIDAVLNLIINGIPSILKTFI